MKEKGHFYQVSMTHWPARVNFSSLWSSYSARCGPKRININLSRCYIGAPRIPSDSDYEDGEGFSSKT